LKYKHLTSFYGSVERALAFHENGDPRYFSDVQSAVHAAVKIGETGPFTLVTRVELIPDERQPEPGGPPPIYWTPPAKEQPNPVDAELAAKRRQLQEDICSALINFGSKKGDAIAIAKALPIEITELSPALNWAMRRK
jgi:hypothetical protein